MDHNVFVTILHEFEPGTFNYTGRTTVLPNSVFLSQPMRNDSLMRDYAYHGFSLTLDPVVDVFAERPAIEEIVARHHSPHSEAAARANALIEQRFHVDLMDAQVRVAFRTTDLGKYRLGVTLFCPTRMAEALENDIICEVMSYLHGVAERQRHQETASRIGPAMKRVTPKADSGGPTLHMPRVAYGWPERRGSVPMLIFFYALDTLAIMTALAASWLWYSAGRRPVRRISRSEELDAADINRMVVAMNRSAILNRRAALATAASAACLALRFAADLTTVRL